MATRLLEQKGKPQPLQQSSEKQRRTIQQRRKQRTECLEQKRSPYTATGNKQQTTNTAIEGGKDEDGKSKITMVGEDDTEQITVMEKIPRMIETVKGQQARKEIKALLIEKQ